jgi:uncharacterized protein (DUF1684 family)
VNDKCSLGLAQRNPGSQYSAPFATRTGMTKMTAKQLVERDTMRDMGTGMLLAMREMKADSAARTPHIQVTAAAVARAKTGCHFFP